MEGSNKALVLADGEGNLYAVALETVLNGRIPTEQREAVEQAIVTTEPEVLGYGKPDDGPKPPKDPSLVNLSFSTVGLVLAEKNTPFGLLPAVIPAAGGAGGGRL